MAELSQYWVYLNFTFVLMEHDLLSKGNSLLRKLLCLFLSEWNYSRLNRSLACVDKHLGFVLSLF